MIRLIRRLKNANAQTRFRSLEGVDLKTLHQAFVIAFSDYSVRMDMSLERFRDMLYNNGFSPELSVGAFQKEELTGFVLNCIGTRGGSLSAYDSGTGVVPACRNKGIASEMFCLAFERLTEAGVRDYSLEVLRSNNTAVHLYEKLGFQTARKLECYRAEKKLLHFESSSNVDFVEPGGLLQETDEIALCRDFTPTWQNAGETVSRTVSDCTAAVARKNDLIAGFGIINRKTGAVYQLAVNRGYRQTGIASSLLAELIKTTQASAVSFLNVDSRCEDLCDFLHRRGFSTLSGQYEMVKRLR